MADTIFGDLVDVYEAMIDWPKRLANEEPFYRQAFAEPAVERVVDVACGTGHHAGMFHSWGLRVEGSDISRQMIQRARATHGESDGLRWVVRDFCEPIEQAEPFDAAVCVGNSLALLAPDMATAERAIHRMVNSVRDGGLVIVHVLNLWHLPDGPSVWQKCKRTTIGRDEVLILKGVHRCGDRGYMDLVVTSLAGETRMHHQAQKFLGLEAKELTQMARRAGARDVRFSGGYHQGPYDREDSVDLIMVARHPGCS